MLNAKNKFFYLLVAFFLSACQRENYTVDYLLEHPEVLENELQVCVADNIKSNTETLRCKIAGEAATKIRVYVEAQQTDPEKFGQRILETEIVCVKTKTEFEKAKNNLHDLQVNHASSLTIAAAQKKLAATEKIYRDKKREVKILLAVVGLNSPE